MLLVALGNTEVIGANSYYVQVEGTGLMLDAGADPEVDGPEGMPDFDRIHRNPGWYVDHAIVTHAHHDHIGSLPVLIQHFPHVMIHMTRATRDLTEFALPASARLQRRRRREGSSPHDPLFTEEELEVYSYLYLTHDLETDFDVTGLKGASPVKARFYDAGHLLGSAGVLLTFEEGGQQRRVFYTGDTSLRPQTIIPGGSFPDEPVDVLILESTLGADPEAELSTRKMEEIRFAESLRRVLERGGTVLIPVFAMGRAQEVLALLDRFKRRNLIPAEVPVYTAGSMRAVADVYDKARHSTPRLDPDFQVFGVEQRRLPRSDSAVKEALRQPSIHVVSSGMLFERTISNRLAQELVEDEKNGVFLVGFAREDSPAHRLLVAAEEGKGTEKIIDTMRGPQPINCDVDRFRLSGHSHRRDLVQLVEQLQPKQVVLVHGEPDARTWLSDNIRFFYPDVVVHQLQTGVPLEV